MPFDDWQFWVVTSVMLLGLYLVKRAVWPSAKRAGGKRVKLTIEKRKT